MHNPRTGELIRMNVGRGASVLHLQGDWIPFLEWRRGSLICQYNEELEDPDHPVRRKIVELSQTLRASIFLDVQDEPLEW